MPTHRKGIEYVPEKTYTLEEEVVRSIQSLTAEDTAKRRVRPTCRLRPINFTRLKALPKFVNLTIGQFENVLRSCISKGWVYVFDGVYKLPSRSVAENTRLG